MENKQPPRVTFSRSEKINMGNFESKDIFVSISIDLDDDMVKAVADINKAAPTLVAGLMALVDQQKAEIKMAAGAPVKTEQPKSEVKKTTWKPRG